MKWFIWMIRTNHRINDIVKIIQMYSFNTTFARENFAKRSRLVYPQNDGNESDLMVQCGRNFLYPSFRFLPHCDLCWWFTMWTRSEVKLTKCGGLFVIGLKTVWYSHNTRWVRYTTQTKQKNRCGNQREVLLTIYKRLWKCETK